MAISETIIIMNSKTMIKVYIIQEKTRLKNWKKMTISETIIIINSKTIIRVYIIQAFILIFAN